VLSRRRLGADTGSLTLLVIGYVGIAAMLVVVAVDVSKVFLARRALSASADSAALAGAQVVDRATLYAGTAGGCRTRLPLDPARSTDAVTQTLADDETDLRHAFAALDPPDTSVRDGVVTVRLAGDVAVPFGSVLASLLPGHGDGRVHVAVSASAESPVSGVPGC
jgi:hypothetical protein